MVVLVYYNKFRWEFLVKQEVLRHKKLSLFVLIALFVVLYVLVIGVFEIANRTINLGVGLLIAQIVFLYIYLMFVMRTQLLYFEYTINDSSLIIKEFLSKREKTIIIIPLTSILSIEEEQQHKNSFYNRMKKISKRHVKNTKTVYIEYDDYADISLLVLQCSSGFLDDVCKRI